MLPIYLLVLREEIRKAEANGLTGQDAIKAGAKAATIRCSPVSIGAEGGAWVGRTIGQNEVEWAEKGANAGIDLTKGAVTLGVGLLAAEAGPAAPVVKGLAAPIGKFCGEAQRPLVDDVVKNATSGKQPIKQTEYIPN